MIMRISLIVILCQALAYAPLLNVAQLSLPSDYLIAPEISQENTLVRSRKVVTILLLSPLLATLE